MTIRPAVKTGDEGGDAFVARIDISANPEWLAAYNGNLVGDFGATYGLWQYDGSAWSQISTSDPDNIGNTMVAYNNGLAVDFGSYGLWYYDGTTWYHISPSDAQ